MYKIKRISNKLILKLSISTPFLVGNQPEVSNTIVGCSVSKRTSFTLWSYITINLPIRRLLLTLSLTLSQGERTFNNFLSLIREGVGVGNNLYIFIKSIPIYIFPNQGRLFYCFQHLTNRIKS